MFLTSVCPFLRLSICESVPCSPVSDRRCYEGRACAGECGCSCQSERSVYLGSGRHWSDFRSLGKCPDLHKSFCVGRTNGPEASLAYSFWLRNFPASTRVAAGGFLFCLGSTEYEKAQGIGESRRSYGI